MDKRDAAIPTEAELRQQSGRTQSTAIDDLALRVERFQAAAHWGEAPISPVEMIALIERDLNRIARMPA